MGSDYLRLAEMIKHDKWSEAAIKEFPQFFRKGEWLTEQDNLVLYQETRFVPDPKIRPQILLEAHGVRMGLTPYKGEDSGSILVARMGPRGRPAHFHMRTL